MASQAQPNPDWRLQMTGEDRAKVCNIILNKLRAIYQPMLSEQIMRGKTLEFEQNMYARATSRHDYLLLISTGIDKANRQAEQQAERRQTAALQFAAAMQTAGVQNPLANPNLIMQAALQPSANQTLQQMMNPNVMQLRYQMMQAAAMNQQLAGTTAAYPMMNAATAYPNPLMQHVAAARQPTAQQVAAAHQQTAQRVAAAQQQTAQRVAAAQQQILNTNNAQQLQYQLMQQGSMQSTPPPPYQNLQMAAHGLMSHPRTSSSHSNSVSQMAMATQNNTNLQVQSMNRNQSRPVAAAPNQQRGQTHPAAELPKEFWTMLDEMKRKYKPPLNDLLPVISAIAKMQSDDKRKDFERKFKQCCHILRITPATIVSRSLDMSFLQKVSKYLDRVIQVARETRSRRHSKAAHRNAAMTMSLNDGGAQQHVAGSHAAHAQRPMNVTFQGNQPGQQQQPGVALATTGGIVPNVAQASTNVASAGMSSLVQQSGDASQYPNKINPARAVLSATASVGTNVMSQNTAVAHQQDAGSHVVHTQDEKQVNLQGNQPSEQQQPGIALDDADPQIPDATKTGAKATTAGMSSSDQQTGDVNQLPKLKYSAAQLARLEREMPMMLERMNQTPERLTPVELGLQQQGALIERFNDEYIDTEQVTESTPSGNVNIMTMSNTQERQNIDSSRDIQILAGHQVSQVPAKAAHVQNSTPLSADVGLTRTHANLSQNVENLEAKVRKFCRHAIKWETHVTMLIKHEKAKRIHDTLNSLRNVSNLFETTNYEGGQKDCPSSHVDVQNRTDDDKVNRPNTVFECSSENSLQLAKRPRNELMKTRVTRNAVEAECKAAEERNPILDLKIVEQFGRSVVECMLLIHEIKLPKLTLRVPHGYPQNSNTAYSFELPPLGWTGILATIRDGFKRSLKNVPTASVGVGVGVVLDIWACQAETAVVAEFRPSICDLSSTSDESDAAA